MGFFIDLIALIVIVISAGIAYYKGFVKTFFGFISTIVAIILACILCKFVATQIKDLTEIDEWIITSIQSIEFKEAENEEFSSDSSMIESGDSTLVSFIDTLPNYVTESLDFEETKNNLKNSIALKISDTVINIISWLLIYVVVRVILLIITIIFDGIMSIPFLKTINNLAGLFLGAMMGIFRIYLTLAIIYFISNLIDITSLIIAIQSSMVVSHMYNSNLLISLIF